MRRRFTAICFYMLCVSSVVAAQDDNAVWGGEWGAFQRSASTPQPGYAGERLLISDCNGGTCHLEISVETPAQAHCDNTGAATLQIESATNATAQLGGGKCSISLIQAGSAAAPAINAIKSSPGCSDFCTAGASFERNYPLHARTRYYGNAIAACYTTTSKAQAAICGDPSLAAQEYAWQIFSMQVTDLEDKPTAVSSEETTLQAACDNAADPAACLKDKFEQATTALQQRKDVWVRQATRSGDSTEAAAKIAKITGHYRHTFQNGDVQGDTFKSTDTLRISRVSAASVRYSLALHFYNGHECSMSGLASYKANGAFVDEERSDTADGHLADTCYFHIVATPTGIRFRDPNGACRSMSCGARGGYGGAGFTFAEKMKPAR